MILRFFGFKQEQRMEPEREQKQERSINYRA